MLNGPAQFVKRHLCFFTGIALNFFENHAGNRFVPWQ
jgi:hypothetical protein